MDGTSRTICYSWKIFWRAKNQLSSEKRKALQSLKGNTYVNVKKELSSQWFFYTTSQLKTASLTKNPTDIFIPWPYLHLRGRDEILSWGDSLMTEDLYFICKANIYTPFYYPHRICGTMRERLVENSLIIKGG